MRARMTEPSRLRLSLAALLALTLALSLASVAVGQDAPAPEPAPAPAPAPAPEPPATGTEPAPAPAPSPEPPVPGTEPVPPQPPEPPIEGQPPLEQPPPPQPPVFQVPKGCHRVTGPDGIDRIECERPPEQAPSCPVISPEAEQKCKDNGGTAYRDRDPRGCDFLRCEFKRSEGEGGYFERRQCPTAEEHNRVGEKCAALGLKTRTVNEGGCRVPICEEGSEGRFRGREGREEGPKCAEEGSAVRERRSEEHTSELQSQFHLLF